MKIIDLVIGIVLIISVMYTAYTFGYNASEADNALVSDWLEISDNNNSYLLHKTSKAYISEIWDDLELRYEIEISDIRGEFKIIYTDQLIDGDIVTAKEWVDSFVMAFEEFKNVK